MLIYYTSLNTGCSKCGWYCKLELSRSFVHQPLGVHALTVTEQEKVLKTILELHKRASPECLAIVGSGITYFQTLGYSNDESMIREGKKQSEQKTP